jgi:hypothetical protein
MDFDSTGSQWLLVGADALVPVGAQIHSIAFTHFCLWIRSHSRFPPVKGDESNQRRGCDGSAPGSGWLRGVGRDAVLEVFPYRCASVGAAVAVRAEIDG